MLTPEGAYEAEPFEELPSDASFIATDIVVAKRGVIAPKGP